jgi:hypothetical protein
VTERQREKKIKILKNVGSIILTGTGIDTKTEKRRDRETERQ